MSKLAIILCVALFAASANASYWSDAFTAAQEKVKGIIDAAMKEVKTIFDAIIQKSFEVADKFEAAALEYTQKVTDEIAAILQNVQDEVDKLTGKADGVNVTECTQMAAHLDQTALSVIANMSTCIVDKIELGAGYIDSMIQISDNLLANLSALREEAHRCGDNIDGIASGLQAIACTNIVAAKATWTATKAVPAFSIKVTKLAYMLTTLQPSLAYCATTNGLVTFYHESSTIVENMKKCVEQKIDEHRDGEPGAHTTEFTEEPEYTTVTQTLP